MAEHKGPRAYDSPLRRGAAEATRRDILEAARELLLERGYVRTTMSEVARRAGVALDTVYASVGRKPQLVRLLLESSISGVDQVVPAEQREYVRAFRAEPDARRKLEIYAAAVAAIMPQLAPLVRFCKDSGSSDPDIAALWQEISERRAANMRRLVADLATTGRLHPGLSQQDAADQVWVTNSPEVFDLFVQRGWTVPQYQEWLVQTWTRLLLRG
jgi:AcrR family transcriptional regulator